MRIALFIDEEDVNAIRVHLENKYNGEVTMTQIEAYVDSLIQDKVREIKDADRDTRQAVPNNAESST